MEAWFFVGLLLAAAGVFVTRNHPVVQGIAVGLFAGLMMSFFYPLMPLVGKGIVVYSIFVEEPPKAEALINGLGWLVILFPVSIFYLAYSRRFPMSSFSLFGSAAVFAISYSAVLQIAVFQSALMGVLINFLVFFAVFISMVIFGWLVRGICYIASIVTAGAVGEAEQGIAGTEGYRQI